MIKSLNILKKYYSLAKVKPFLILLEFFLLLIPAIVSVVSPVILAKVISAITVFDYAKATRALLLDFVLILISAFSYFAYHFVSAKVNKIIALNIEDFIYQNVKQNPNIKKINYSTLDNVWKCVSFNKTLLYKICFLIKSIVLLVIIFSFNSYISLILIGVSIVSFFLFNFVDSKIQFNNQLYSKQQQESLDFFNSIRKGISLENNFNFENVLKDKYFEYVHENVKISNKISFLYNINNNFITLILKTAVFLSTIYLITLVKNTTLTLSLYLILTPYLTLSAQNLISFFEIFSDFGTIDNIFNEFESLKFAEEPPTEQPIELSTFNLYFFEVSTNGKNSPKLSNFNLKIEHKKFVNFVGDSSSTKQTIFKLIEKTEKPISGSIFLDNKNINEIPPQTYNSTISLTSKNPHFYNISLFENLFMVCPNKTKINHALKVLGLKTMISFLPNKLNTDAQTLSPKTAFFMGIARSYLSNAKIIAINDVPEHLTSDETELLSQILKVLKKEKTILLFSHTSLFEQLTDTTLFTENNKKKGWFLFFHIFHLYFPLFLRFLFLFFSYEYFVEICKQ